MAMKKAKLALLLIFSAMLISCATQQAKPSFRPYKFPAGQYVQQVDNFMVILDASGSMSQSYEGRVKFGIAKEILSRMNQTIPDLDFFSGLRTFGQGFWFFGKKTTLVYGMTVHSQARLQGAIDAVKHASGRSPLALAIDSATEDLRSTTGKIAVIIVSDGVQMDNAPVKAAKNMRSVFGDRVCIYTVMVGGSAEGKNILEQVAGAGSCGFSVGGEQIATVEGMADFVEKVFLAKPGKPSDRDGDGVADTLDKCPNTPRGVKVDAQGCPLDSDGDGIYDYLDQCPDTPRGARVDERGCWVIRGVQFEIGKSDIKPSSYPVLDEIVEVLESNPSLRIEIEGHTDSTGSAAFNQTLSEQRAKAVMEYFVVSRGISSGRLSAKGYGFSRPAASNATAAGRAKNRRVELKPMY